VPTWLLSLIVRCSVATRLTYVNVRINIAADEAKSGERRCVDLVAMIMIDQSKRLSEPLGWTRAGKIAVAIVAACLVISVIGVGVYALAGGTRQAKDCISVTFPSTLGAAYLSGCGTHAKELCASPASNPGAEADGALQRACRRAGYPYGAVPHSS
jgi:hypothetical protein